MSIQYGMSLKQIRYRMKRGEKFYHGPSCPDDGKKGKRLTRGEINAMITAVQ